MGINTTALKGKAVNDKDCVGYEDMYEIDSIWSTYGRMKMYIKLCVDSLFG